MLASYETNNLLNLDYKELKVDGKRLEHIQSLSSVLSQLLGDELLPNPTELIQIYGKVRQNTLSMLSILKHNLQMLVNAFNVLDQEMNSIGTGIYLGVSVTDHNCTPNAVATFEGTKIFIRVTEDIPCLDWSKVTKFIFLLSYFQS